MTGTEGAELEKCMSPHLTVGEGGMDNHFHYRDYRVLPVEEEEETGSAGVIGVFSFGNDSLSTVCLDRAWPVGNSTCVITASSWK